MDQNHVQRKRSARSKSILFPSNQSQRPSLARRNDTRPRNGIFDLPLGVQVTGYRLYAGSLTGLNLPSG